MSKNTREFFESLSRFCYVSKSPCSFTKNEFSHDKYQKGMCAVYDWVDELCYYYLKREKELKGDFLTLLNKKKTFIGIKTDSEYKRGMVAGFDEIHKIIRELS